MRAPVYRNIDATSTVLGLAFPTEALVMMTVLSIKPTTISTV